MYVGGIERASVCGGAAYLVMAAILSGACAGAASRPMPESEHRAIVARNDASRKLALEDARKRGFAIVARQSLALHVPPNVSETCAKRALRGATAEEAPERAMLRVGSEEALATWDDACAFHRGASSVLSVSIGGRALRLAAAESDVVMANAPDGRRLKLRLRPHTVRTHVFLEPGRACCCANDWSPGMPRTSWVTEADVDAPVMELPFDIEELRGVCDPAAPQ